MHGPGRAFVLAGGLSSRMGEDKARLHLGGTSLLERSLGMLRGLGFTVAVAGLRQQEQPCSAPIVDDTFPGSGPLAGIEAALGSLGELPPQPVLFVAVDLPLLPASFVAFLWARALATGALATVPYAAGRPQPLCAVYHTSLAAGMHAALASGDRKVMRVLEAITPPARLDRFRVEALPCGLASSLFSPHVAPRHRWFANVNTPGDWESIHGTFDLFSGGVGGRSGISQPAALPATPGTGAK